MCLMRNDFNPRETSCRMNIMLKCFLLIFCALGFCAAPTEGIFCYVCDVKGNPASDACAKAKELTYVAQAHVYIDECDPGVTVCKSSPEGRSCGLPDDKAAPPKAGEEAKCVGDAAATCCSPTSDKPNLPCNTAVLPAAQIIHCWNCTVKGAGQCESPVKADDTTTMVACKAGATKCKATSSGRSCGAEHDMTYGKGCLGDLGAMCCKPPPPPPPPPPALKSIRKRQNTGLVPPTSTCNDQPLPPPQLECYKCTVSKDDLDPRCPKNTQETLKCRRAVQMCRLRDYKWICGMVGEGCRDGVAHCCPGSKCNVVGAAPRIGAEDLAGSKGAEGAPLVPTGVAVALDFPTICVILPAIILIMSTGRVKL